MSKNDKNEYLRIICEALERYAKYVCAKNPEVCKKPLTLFQIVEEESDCCCDILLDLRENHRQLLKDYLSNNKSDHSMQLVDSHETLLDPGKISELLTGSNCACKICWMDMEPIHVDD